MCPLRFLQDPQAGEPFRKGPALPVPRREDAGRGRKRGPGSKDREATADCGELRQGVGGAFGRLTLSDTATHLPCPPPPLANSRVSARVTSDGLPGGGGGAIAIVFQGKLWYPPLMQAKRTRVKRLLRCCGANVFHPKQMLLRIQRNGKELLGTRITHFELLHMLSLHDRHGVHQVCVSGAVHHHREETSWV